MSRVLGLLILSVVLAIIKAVLVGLSIALALALAYAFVRRPRETLLFIGALTLSGLATAQPLAALIVMGAVSVVAVLARRKAPMLARLPDRNA